MTTEAERATRRAWKRANREKIRAYKKAHYAKYRERELAKQRAKRAGNRERLAEHRRKRYAAEKETRCAEARARYAADPDHAARVLEKNRRYRASRIDKFRERDKAYARAYQERHPDRFMQIHRRANMTRRALLVGAFVEDVNPLEVFQRDKGVCGICKRNVDPESKWHVDHVIPLSKGGAHSYDNVQLAHATCNLSKLNKVPTGQLGHADVSDWREVNGK